MVRVWWRMPLLLAAHWCLGWLPESTLGFDATNSAPCNRPQDQGLRGIYNIAEGEIQAKRAPLNVRRLEFQEEGGY
jgi:hypothetical protein